MAEELFSGFGDQKILAERANKDINGNSIVETYATKDELNHVAPSGATPTSSLTCTGADTFAWAGWNSTTVTIPLPSTVKFGDISYPYVKIGNLYWMTENFRNPIGTKGTDYWEYDNGSDPQKYGLIYKDSVLMKPVPSTEPSDALAALLHDGWRIPTRADFYELARGISEYDGIKLISKKDGGTDTKSFNGRVSGTYREPGHGYSDNGFKMTSMQLYTSADYGAASQRYVFLLSNQGNGSYRVVHGNALGGSTYLYGCLRLCCPVT